MLFSSLSATQLSYKFQDELEVGPQPPRRTSDAPSCTPNGNPHHSRSTAHAAVTRLGVCPLRKHGCVASGRSGFRRMLQGDLTDRQRQFPICVGDMEVAHPGEEGRYLQVQFVKRRSTAWIMRHVTSSASREWRLWTQLATFARLGEILEGWTAEGDDPITWRMLSLHRFWCEIDGFGSYITTWTARK